MIFGILVSCFRINNLYFPLIREPHFNNGCDFGFIFHGLSFANLIFVFSKKLLKQFIT